MTRAHGAEMPVIQGDHQVRVQALGQRDDRSIRATEPTFPVLLNQIRNPKPILRCRSFDVDIRQAAQEFGFDRRTEPAANQVRHLGHNEGGDNQPQVGTLISSRTSRGGSLSRATLTRIGESKA